MHTFAHYAALAVVLVLVGCPDDAGGTCPNVAGTFLASYQRLEGECDVFPGNALTVSVDDHGTVTKVENRLSDTVTTKVVFKGCTLGVTQSVAAGGLMISEISGDLQVEDASALSGMMLRTEFMPDGAVICHGVYDVRYTRQDLIVGGAVEHAQSTP